MSLAAAAVMVKTDISTIECRHASIRRTQVVSSSQTLGKQLEDASADFVCQQLAHAAAPLPRPRRQKSNKSGKASAPPPKARGRRRQLRNQKLRERLGKKNPSGSQRQDNPWKVFVSENAQGQQLRKSLVTRLSLEYRDLKDNKTEEFRRLQQKAKSKDTTYSYTGPKKRKKCRGRLALENCAGATSSRHFSADLQKRVQSIIQRHMSLREHARSLRNERAHRLRTWSVNHTMHESLTALFPLEHNVLDTRPHGASFNIAQWRPPTKHIVQQVASRFSVRERESFQQLRHDKHRMVRMADSERLPPVRSGRTACHLLGVCIHQGLGRTIYAFEQKYSKVLKTIFTKDSRPRHLLQDSALVVLRLTSRAGAAHWFHASYVNYHSWLCILLPLVESDCIVRSPLSLISASPRTSDGRALMVRPWLDLVSFG